MAEPFVAEIRMLGFNFAPRGWATCDGQVLPIQQNTSLYSIIGTTYGGDGVREFALPDLRGRTPIHFGQSGAGTSHPIGEKGGTEAHPLSSAEMPSHTHGLMASNGDASSNNPANLVLAKQGGGATEGFGTLESVANLYGSPGENASMAKGALSQAGGSLPHNNMQPFLVLNFCIALVGLYPSRN